MKLADMQLKHYHFNRLLLEAAPESSVDSGFLGMSAYREANADSLKTSILLAEPEAVSADEEPFFLLTLGLEYNQQGFPYSFAVEVDGIFSLSSVLGNSEEIRHRLVVNAASILYSSVRDQLLTLSARHKYGPMMLPSLDFRSIAPQR